MQKWAYLAENTAFGVSFFALNQINDLNRIAYFD